MVPWVREHGNDGGNGAGNVDDNDDDNDIIVTCRAREHIYGTMEMPMTTTVTMIRWSPIVVARGEEGLDNLAHHWEISRVAQLWNLCWIIIVSIILLKISIWSTFQFLFLILSNIKTCLTACGLKTFRWDQHCWQELRRTRSLHICILHILSFGLYFVVFYTMLTILTLQRVDEEFEQNLAARFPPTWESTDRLLRKNHESSSSSPS